jgi:flagellar basal body-associated protein FliL
MKRRNFITLTTLATASVGISFLHCNSADKVYLKKIAIPLPLSQFIDETEIKSIGKMYADKHPDEYSIEHLEQQLQANKQGKKISTSANINEIYDAIRENMTNDFDSGNYVVMNGWVISITEARQCALYSLVAT